MPGIKKRRTADPLHADSDHTSSIDDLTLDAVLQRQLTAHCAPHPFGVRPEGNRYLDRLDAAQQANGDRVFRDTRTLGLGRLAILSDELLLQHLLHRLSVTELARLEQVSRACYTLVRHDEEWKERVLGRFGGAFHFQDSWRSTYAYEHAGRQPPTNVSATKIQAPFMYSDVLFRPWHYAAVELGAFVGADAPETVDRRHNLSVEAFREEYERPNRPVIIADGARRWPALQHWHREELLRRYAKTQFRAESVDIALEDYLRYAEHQQEEAPLYLFDRGFTQRCPEMRDEFTVPDYFSEDLFSLLGDEHRPDYRWLIVGPARSGSSFHKDPNATSAWNAVVCGAKKWVLFPPNTLPPGVYANEDESEVTAPVSVMEWFHHYYAQARRLPTPPLECVCRTGEVMFVPRGWWHCVINLEYSVAVTQNYVSRSNLPQVLAFLRDRPEQISGLRGIVDEDCDPRMTQDASAGQGALVRANMYSAFCQALVKTFPDEMPAIIEREQEEAAAAQQRRDAAQWWRKLKAPAEDLPASNNSGGFSFSFSSNEQAPAAESTSSGFQFNFLSSADD